MSEELLRLLRLLRRRRPRNAGGKGALAAGHERTDTSKFIVGPWDVKVAFPVGSRPRVAEILDRHPAGSSLEAVTGALAKIGASFVPWSDDSPGDSGAYFSAAERDHLASFPIPRTEEQAGVLLASLVQDAAIVTSTERSDPRVRALMSAFSEWDWERVIARAACAQATRRAELRRRALLEAHRDSELEAIARQWEHGAIDRPTE